MLTVRDTAARKTVGVRRRNFVLRCESGPGGLDWRPAEGGRAGRGSEPRGRPLSGRVGDFVDFVDRGYSARPPFCSAPPPFCSPPIFDVRVVSSRGKVPSGVRLST